MLARRPLMNGPDGSLMLTRREGDVAPLFSRAVLGRSGELGGCGEDEGDEGELRRLTENAPRSDRPRSLSDERFCPFWGEVGF